MESIDIEISLGKVVIRKPLAGARNKAVEIAEQPDGSIKQSTLIFTLLPMCIKGHPFDNKIPLTSSLNSLSTTDYDLLANGLRTLMEKTNPEGDIKKSEPPLNTE